MAFRSILFPKAADGAEERAREPDFFADLNLDQIVATVTAPKQEYGLKPLFYRPLHDPEEVAFRHEILRDLEKPVVARLVKNFAFRMREVRAHLRQSEKRRNKHQKMRWFVDAVTLYAKAAAGLAADLASAELDSRGLIAFRDHMSAYAASERFKALAAEAERLLGDLAAIRYTILIDGLRVTVEPYGGQSDYGRDVAALFARFEGGEARTYPFEFGDFPDVDWVEGSILQLVANLHGEVFGRLARFCEANGDFQDAAVALFDREIQFYIAYLDHIAPLKKAGLSFCYPRVSRDDKSVMAAESFDLALATKLAAGHALPVTNGFALTGRERIVVVTGPNQGGKTTFARLFGQLHYLASLGLPVPGSQAHLYLPDRIFSHFERTERMTSLTGKLQDDLLRIHAILDAATPDSILVINEIFTSTTLKDALVLSRRIAAAIMAEDMLCVWVTFIDEIATLGEKTVSMVSETDPDQPDRRTFKIVRRPPDGLAHAMSIARKYRLTRDMILDRIAP